MSDRRSPGPLFAWAAQEPEAAADRCPRTDPTLPERLARRFSKSLGYALEVRLSRSLSQPVRLEVQGGPAGRRGRLSLHRGLDLEAEPLLSALEAWLVHGRRAKAASLELDRAVSELLQKEPRRGRPPVLESRGRCHDLGALVAQLLEAQPHPSLGQLSPPPEVGWGRFANRPPKRGLWLGSYDARQHVVRVHPALDDDEVPAFFVTSVLYHELLHAALPHEFGPSGRRLTHGPLFRLAESAHPDAQRAVVFQRNHLPKLLAAARRGARRARARQAAKPQA